MKEGRIVFSGGGTAGHIFPALTVSQRIREKAPGVRTVFIGGRRPLEKNLMEHYGAEFASLKIEGLKGRGLKSLKAVLLLPGAFLRTISLLLRIKPGLSVGLGGYSSGPVVLLSSLLRIPTVIMEQNVRPGLTNRLLLRWADKAVLSFEESAPYFKGKGIVLGNPVRDEFHSIGIKSEGPFTLLVSGGSQGSRFLNQAVSDALPFLRELKDEMEIIHQTGSEDQEWIEKVYRENGFSGVTVASFFHDMPERFRQADLVICRAGATTIAELIAARKPAVLVPFALAAENHQEQNARELEKRGAAAVITENDLSAELLAETIAGLKKAPEKLRKMEDSLSAMRKSDAAGRIADLCLQLMKPLKRRKKRG